MGNIMKTTRTTSNAKLLALVAVILSVALAGCAGWGTGAPANATENEGTTGTDTPNETPDTGEEAATDGDSSSGSTDSSDSDADESTGIDEANTTDPREQDTSGGGDEPDSSTSDGSEVSEDTEGRSGSNSDTDATDTDDSADITRTDDQSADTGDGDGDSSDEDVSDEYTQDDSEQPTDGNDTDNSSSADDRDRDTGGDDGSDDDENNGENTTDDGDNTGDANTNQSGDNNDDTDTNGDENDGSEDDTENETDTEVDPETHTLTVVAGEYMPVTDLPITLERLSDGATTTNETDSYGTTEFTVTDGEYRVSGTDPNGNEAEKTVTISGEDRRVTLGALEQEWPDTHTLTVRVVDQDGDPVEGAVVSGLGDRLPSGADAMAQNETSENGVAELSVWGDMSYTIDGRTENAQSDPQDISIDGDTETTITLNIPDSARTPEETGNETGVGNDTNSTNTSASPALAA